MRKTREKRNAWFTLIEAMASLTLLWMMFAVFYVSLDFQQQHNLQNNLQQESLLNINSVSDKVSSFIKNSYGISRSESNVDKLVLFSDKLERNKISIYLKKDNAKDISRIFYFDWFKETPLNGSNLYITKLEFWYPVFDKDLQPFVSINIKWKTRSPLLNAAQDRYFNIYNKSESQLYWRWVIRNYVPSSNK